MTSSYLTLTLIEYPNRDILKELEERDFRTEISLKDAFELYQKDERFRKMLSFGDKTYKDGNFVNDNGEPLKFADVFKNKKIVGIKVIPINDVDERYDDLLSSMKYISKIVDDNKITLDECLNGLFDERGWSVDDFKCETFLNRDFFSKIRNGKKNKMNKKTLIQILIGLQLPKTERDYLLSLNETTLSQYVKEDVLYSFILDSKIDIGTADSLLKELGEAGF